MRKDTYSLVDKRVFGSFCDPERFYCQAADCGGIRWDIVAELYRRSGGRLDEVETLVRGDGAPFIRGFRNKYALLSKYILDYYHMCRKVRDRLYRVYEKEKRRAEVRENIMKYLHSGDIDDALEYVQKLSKRFRSNSKRHHLPPPQSAVRHLSSYEVAGNVVEQEGSRCSAQYPHTHTKRGVG